jgi:uncharacterized damage-inducible protein DinB
MKVRASDVLRESFEASCQRVTRTLTGITEEEFFWEPVAGCWTVHRRSEQRAKSADGSGEWVIDYELPEPQPAPVTTIAWRTVHIAAVNYLYYDYAFGPATASFDLEMPGSAAAAVEWLRASQEQLRAVMRDSVDADLEAPRLTNWGDLWPGERIWRTLIDEQVHHGAEISLLRDLYRYRDSLGQPRPGPEAR